MPEPIKLKFSPVCGSGLGISYSSHTQVGDLVAANGLGSTGIHLFPNLSNGNLTVQDHFLQVHECNFPLDLGFTYNSQAENKPGLSWRFSQHKTFAQFPKPSDNIAKIIEGDGHITSYLPHPQNPTIYLAPGCDKNGTPFLQFDVASQTWIWHHPGTQITELYNLKGELIERRDAQQRKTKFHYRDNQLYHIEGPSVDSHYYLIPKTNSDGTRDITLYYCPVYGSLILKTYQFDARGRLRRSWTPLKSPPHLQQNNSDNNASLPERDPEKFHAELVKQAPQLPRLSDTLDLSALANEYSITEFAYAGNTLQLTQITQSDQTQACLQYQDNKVSDLIFGDEKAAPAQRVSINYQNGNPAKTTIHEGNSTLLSVMLDNQQRLTQLRQPIEQPTDPHSEPTRLDLTHYEYAPPTPSSHGGQIAKIIHPDKKADLFEHQNAYGLLTKTLDRDLNVDEFHHDRGDFPKEETKLSEAPLPPEEELFALARVAVEKTESEKYKLSREKEDQKEEATASPVLCNLLAHTQYRNTSTQATTRYVWNSSPDKTRTFLRFKISPEGRVTEYIPDQNGQVRFKRKFLKNKFNLIPSEFPTLEDMEKWVAHEIENWKKDWPVYHDELFTLTEYQWDKHGQLWHQTNYASIDPTLLNEISSSYLNAQPGEARKEVGALATTPIDKTTGPHPQTQESWFLFDIYGNCEETKEIKITTPEKPPVIAITRQTFDGLSRKTSHTNALNQKTTFDHNDTKSQTQVTLPNGRVETTTNNSAGDIILQQASAKTDQGEEKRITQIISDTIANPIITLQPDGQRRFQFCDAQHRPIFMITPAPSGSATQEAGYVTQCIYNREFNFECLIRYANPILISAIQPDPKKLPRLDLVEKAISKDEKEDRITYTFFNSQKLPRYIVDEDQYVIEIIYNSRYKKIAEIAYKEKLSKPDFDKLKNGEAIDLKPKISSKIPTDRMHQYFYDKDDLLIGEQDPAGYVTEYIRDAGGRIKEKIIYHQNKSLQFPVPADFKQVRPEVHAKDAHTYYYYNALNCIGEVDAENYYTSHTHFASGLIATSKRYARKVNDPAWEKDKSRRPVVPLISPEDQLTTFTYDLLDREMNIEGPNHQVHRTERDVMGNTTRQQTQDGLALKSIDSDCQRATDFCYDGWDQVQAKANPFVAQKLTAIEADETLTPDQKKEAKADVWKIFSTRHVFDNSGLKLKTIYPFKTPNGTYEDRATIYYYDAARHPIFIINTKGAIIQKSYTRFDCVRIRRFLKNLSKEDMRKLQGGFLTDELRQLFQSLQDPKDPTITKKFTKRSQVETQTDGEGFQWIFEYNAFKECEKEKLPLQNKEPSLIITHEFEGRGLEFKTTHSGGTLKSTVEHKFEHPLGKETETLEGGRVHTQREYDRLARLTRRIDPLNKAHEFEHDAFDQLIAETNALGYRTLHEYQQATREHTIFVAEKKEEKSQDQKHADQKSKKVARVLKKIKQNVFKQKISEMNAQGDHDFWHHAPDGQEDQHIDPNDDKSSVFFNLFSLPEEKSDARSIKTKLHYDETQFLDQHVEDADDAKLTTRFVPDALNRTAQIIDPRNVAHTQDFDRCDRVQKVVTDPTGLGLTEQHEYNGQGTLTATQQGDLKDDNQYRASFPVDELNRGAGKIIDPQGLKIQTQPIKNDLGLVIAEIDANGHVTRHFYDNRKLKRFTIDPKGGTDEWTYDAEKRPTSHRHYDQGVDPTEYNNETTLEFVIQKTQPLQGNRDTLTKYFYDDETNLEIFQVNNEGAVLEKVYDDCLREVLTIAYDQRVDLKLLPTLTSEQLRALMKTKQHPNDRKTYHLRDRKGRECFTIDPGKVITEHRYDGHDNVTLQIVYETRVEDPEKLVSLVRKTKNAAGPSSATDPHPDILQEVYAHIVKNPLDRAVFQFFNARNQLIFKVSPSPTGEQDYSVSGFYFDNNGNPVCDCEFGDAIKIEDLYLQNPNTYKDLLAGLKSKKPDRQKDRVTIHDFDAANRLMGVTDAEGHTDKYKLDGVGNTTEHTNRRGFVTKKSFDRAKRETSELSPEIQLTLVQVNEVDPEKRHLIAQGVKACVEKKTEYDQASNKTKIEVIAHLNLDEKNHGVRHQLIDTEGRLQFILDPVTTKQGGLNYRVTHFNYDEKNLVTECEFVDLLSAPADYDSLLRKLRTLKPDENRDRIHSYIRSELKELEHYHPTPDQVKQNVVMILNDQDEKATPLHRNQVLAVLQKFQAQVDYTPNSIIALAQRAGQKTQVTLPKETRTFIANYDATNSLSAIEIPDVAIDDETQRADFKKRPEKIVTLRTTLINNTQGFPLVERDESGQLLFKLYDTENRLIYQVDHLGGTQHWLRNSFGEVIKHTRFGTPVKLDLTKYEKIGIPLADLKNAIKPDPKKDRVIEKELNNHGDCIAELSGPVIYYAPGENGKPQFGLMKSTSLFQYNASREPIYHASLLIDAKAAIAWAEHLTWRDRSGEVAAETDPCAYIKRYRRNTHKEEESRTAFATPLATKPTLQMSLAELDKATVTHADDRTEETQHNKVGHVSSKIRKNAVSDTLVFDGSTRAPSFRAGKKDLETKFDYDGEGNQTGITFEDGTRERSFFDGRNSKIAHTGVTRTPVNVNADPGLVDEKNIPSSSNSIVESKLDTFFFYWVMTLVKHCSLFAASIFLILRSTWTSKHQDSQQKGVLTPTPEVKDAKDSNQPITPLTHLGVNLAQQIVSTTHFEQGTAQVDSKTIPQPIVRSSNDQTQLSAFNQRGLEEYKQDAEENITAFTHTPKGIIAREFSPTTNWDFSLEQKQEMKETKRTTPQDPILPKTRTHIDEKRRQFDILNRPKKIVLLRDNEVVDITEALFNTFGEKEAEGPGDGTFPTKWRYNPQGKVFASNSEKGKWVISLHDLTQAETARLTSDTQNLSDIDYDQVLDILKRSLDDLSLHVNESGRDLKGQVNLTRTPRYAIPDPSYGQDLPALLLVSSHFPGLFPKPCITWGTPPIKTLQKMFFHIWPRGKENEKQTLTIVVNQEYCGVEIQHLIPGDYEYEITYFMHKPHSQELENTPRFVTRGKLDIPNFIPNKAKEDNSAEHKHQETPQACMFVSEPRKIPFIIVSPQHVKKHDAWGNETSDTDSLGNTTEKTYCEHGVRTVTEPAVWVVNEQGHGMLYRPQTFHGYDGRGRGIGITDANGNTFATQLDEAGQSIRTLLPEGTVSEKRLWDGLGRMITRFNARNAAWKFIPDRLNRNKFELTPTGQLTGHLYNEHSLVGDLDGYGNPTLYNRDVRGDISQRREAENQVTSFDRDCNRQLTEIRLPGPHPAPYKAGIVKHGRDYWGNLKNTTDLSGAFTEFQHDFEMEVVRQVTTGGNHGDYIPWGSRTRTKVTRQDLIFDRQAQRLIGMHDLATKQDIYYRCNSEGQRIQTDIWLNGHLEDQIFMDVDALKRDIRTFNFTMMVENSHDKVGNRRGVSGSVSAIPATAPCLTRTDMNTFDRANRVVVDGGELIDEKIQVTSKQGLEITYAEDLRARQKKWANGRWLYTDLKYDLADRVIGTQDSNGAFSKRTYDRAGNPSSYEESAPTPNHTKKVSAQETKAVSAASPQRETPIPVVPHPAATDKAPLRLREIYLPENGNSLFYAIALSHLLPALNDPERFEILFAQLFGSNVPPVACKIIYEKLEPYQLNPRSFPQKMRELEFLVDTILRQRLVDYIKQNKQEFSEEKYRTAEEKDFDHAMENMAKPRAWGGAREIEAASRLLQKRIIVFTKETGETTALRAHADYGQQWPLGTPIYLVKSASKKPGQDPYHYLIEPLETIKQRNKEKKPPDTQNPNRSGNPVSLDAKNPNQTASPQTTDHNKTINTRNANGWLTHADNSGESNKPHYAQWDSHTTFTTSGQGLPLHQDTYMETGDDHGHKHKIQDNVQLTYIGRDTWQLTKTYGTRTEDGKTGPYASDELLRDPNGSLSARLRPYKEGDFEQSGLTSFLSTPDNLVRKELVHVRDFPLRFTSSLQFLYNGNNELLAHCQIDDPNHKVSLQMDATRFAAGSQGGFPIVPGPSNNSPGVNTQLNCSFPPVAEGRYDVQENDTYEIIARKLYSDESYATVIANANAHIPLSAGQTIWAPAFIPSHNASGMSRPYALLMNEMIGALRPDLRAAPPTSHHGFLTMVIEAMAAAVVLIAAPHLAAFLIPSLTPGFVASHVALATMLDAVYAGLSNAAAQSVGIALHDQRSFSFQSVLASAATAGIARGTRGILPHTGTQLTQTLLNQARLTVASELAQLASGKGGEFNLAVIAANLGAQTLSAHIDPVVGDVLKNNLAGEFATNFLNSALANAAVSAVTGNPFNLDVVAAQAIGSTAGFGIANEANKVLDAKLQRQAEVRIQAPQAESKTPALPNRDAKTPSSFAQTRPKPVFKKPPEQRQDNEKFLSDAKQTLDQLKDFADDTSFLQNRTGNNSTYSPSLFGANKPESPWWQRAKGVGSALGEAGKTLGQFLTERFYVWNHVIKPAGGLIADMGILAFGADYDDSARQRLRNRWTGLRDHYQQLYHDVRSNDPYTKWKAGTEAAIEFAPVLLTDGVGVVGGMGLATKIAKFGSRSEILESAPLFRTGGLSAEEANVPFIEAGQRAPYAEGSRARVIQLQGDRVFVRVHGEGNQARSWMMRPEEIQGLTPEQIKDKFALPEIPSYVSEVHLPRGSYLQLGTTATQAGWGSGGAIQYQALERLPREFFQNQLPIRQYLNPSLRFQP